MFVNEFEKKIFDGFRLFEDRLTLSRNSFFKHRSIEIKFADIEKIVYSEKMMRKGRWIDVFTDKHKYRLLVPYGIFEFADTLKFLKRNNIDIIFERRDREIQLYLADKIDKIPMDNPKTK